MTMSLPVGKSRSKFFRLLCRTPFKRMAGAGLRLAMINNVRAEAAVSKNSLGLPTKFFYHLCIVQVEFVIGPAGSGKTFRCLEQVRAALKASPGGPPLLFLAPKQATFQLERELLSDPELTGYTRLQILSFDRLAEFVLDNYFAAPPRLLS